MSDPNAPMVSEVSICNQALSLLGQSPITAFSDQTTAAEWCRNNYPFLRDAVLQERMWTFATARAKSESNDMDEWEYKYVHKMPAGWIHIHRVFSSPFATHVVRDWVREGDDILASDATVYLLGIKRVGDTGKFSPLFTQALVARLAADGAVPFTANNQLMAQMWQLYGQKLIEAAARDGQQGSNEYIHATGLTNARYR